MVTQQPHTPVVFFIIEGDSEIVVRTNMDLSGCTSIKAAIRDPGTTGAGTERTASLSSPTTDARIPTADLTGPFQELQLRVVTADGKTVTFPDNAWDLIQIDPYIG